MFSIYKIVNKCNNKIYIGYSQRPTARWYEHKLFARRNKKGILYDAMRKHGIENFVFEVIYQSLDEKYAKTVMENYFIEEYSSAVPCGYNIAPGGQGGAIRKGIKHSEETKQKISKAHKNKVLSEETRRKISLSTTGKNNPMYGKSHSQKTKLILSKKAKLRTYDPTCRVYKNDSTNPTSKKYLVKQPCGDFIEVKNLSHFCRLNSLNVVEMRKTLMGKAKQHKGYCVVSKI